MHIRIFLFLVVFFLQPRVSAQNIFELNDNLGRGINMGNMFEAPAENAWGAPYQDDYFERIAGLGFDHVRIPIRWDVPERAMMSPPYTLDPDFVSRIQGVVDEALKEGLKVIINMHHHEEVFADPEGSLSRFLSQWQQIGALFKDYDNNLLFEPLNEPHGNLSAEKWNGYFLEALNAIRENNPTRAVILGVAEYGGLSAVGKLNIPSDDNIILSIHYYEPFHFTHQGAGWVEGSEAWMGTLWENTDLEQNQVINQFQYAIQFADEHHMPIHIGEFGAFSAADMESRILWTSFLARWFESQGFSWAYWEFHAGFGIFDPETKTYNQDLVDALLKDPLPEAKKTETSLVYESNFDTNKDGWNLSTQGLASASFTIENKQAKIEVKTIEAEKWKIQLSKSPFALKKNKRYLVSFIAKADGAFSATSYLGRSSAPWGAYSSYHSVTLGTIETLFQYTFLMTDADDPNARFVFDLGGTIGTAHFKGLKIEEIIEEVEAPLVLANERNEKLPVLYPNPTRFWLKISDIQNYETVKFYNSLGQLQFSFDLRNYTEKGISTKGLPAGIYLVRLEGPKGSLLKRLIIN